MKLLLVALLAFFATNAAFGAQGTFVDEVRFIQYLDENTALEEVRNGNLDLYYYRISSDRIENTKSREGIEVFESTGGSYSILVNPAVSEKFNPFSINDVRYALNFLVDRKLIVNELMGGYGVPMVSNYGPYDPDYLFLLDELESFHFRYNPALAEKLISDALTNAGAEKINNVWTFQNKPIELTAFIRSDDPVRTSIGEILSSELERIGFSVKKDFGDLNKAFVIVYGSDPADLKWSFYTEGWGGRSAFVKYDPVGLGQMYSPWFSNMPGFNDPSYWNYQNDYLDSLTQRIYTGNFTSAEERIDLFKKATKEGVKESVRIFLASKIDQYVVNEKVSGIINDFGAGVPSRFTPINARTDADSITIGVKQIYQGAWNPIMGISDAYSRQIWDAVYDPGVFKHPYTGETFPVRTTWDVQTAGPNDVLQVPDDAIIWDPSQQGWKKVGPGTEATSKVTFDILFSNWHHGQPMDMNDILHSLYFTLEWGSEPQENDKTFDTEYTPRAAQTVQTLVGIRVVDENTIEVYVDYWHFDKSEIADWASIWGPMPWELMVAMENAVIDGKTSFSRSGSVSKSVNWLSLIVPNDSTIILDYLQNFKQSGHVPNFLKSFDVEPSYLNSRYTSSIEWINENNHAVISNGPFYLDSYSPESRTIVIKAFSDPSYPFEAGHWQKFESINFPKIKMVEMPEIVQKGSQITFSIKTENSSQIHYFIADTEGNTISSGIKSVDGPTTQIILNQNQTSSLGEGANDFKLFAVSEQIQRPDIYSTSFFASSVSEKLPPITSSTIQQETTPNYFFNGAIIVVGAIIIATILFFRKRRKFPNKKIKP